MTSVCFQGKPFNITVIQVYVPMSNVEGAEVEWFNGELQGIVELTPKKGILFIIGDWNEKVESQETPGVTGKFGFRVKHPPPTTQEKTLHMDITRWSTQNQTDFIVSSQRWRSSVQFSSVQSLSHV